MKFFFCILIFLPALAFSQNDTARLEFSLIDTIVGSKKEIVAFAKGWIAKSFNSAKAVIEMEDTETGKIIGKAVLDLKDKVTTAHFTITIDTKDNKYRCVFSDYERFVQDANNTNTRPAADGASFEIDPNKNGFMQKSKDKYTLQLRQETQRQSEELLQNLKSYMKNVHANSDF